MKNLFLGLALIFGFSSCADKTEKPVVKQETTTIEHPSIDSTYRPLLHFFTSTGCGGCGRFGIPVFSAVASAMGDSILPLPTHFKYNDKFIGESSLAIEKAIVSHYASPQIWVNMDEITYSIIQYSNADAIEKTKVFLREAMKSEAPAFLGLKAELKANGRFDVALSIEKKSETVGDMYYEIYGLEDGPIGSQAGADPFVATHYRVNRGGYFGGMGKKLEAEVGEVIYENIEYIPCVDCDGTNIYFYAIIWQETNPGKFEYVNGIQFKQ